MPGEDHENRYIGDPGEDHENRYIGDPSEYKPDPYGGKHPIEYQFEACDENMRIIRKGDPEHSDNLTPEALQRMKSEG